MKHIDATITLASSPVHIHADRGDIVLIRGPTGSGKTTLLKTLTGLSAGELRTKVDGQEIEPIWHKTNTAFCFQEPEQQLIMSIVGDEVGNSKRTLELLELMGLSAKRHASHRNLSTGEKKALTLVKTLSSERPLLIFDEPTANLDEERARIFLELIRSLRDRIVIVSSHDPRFMTVAHATVDLGSNYEAETHHAPLPGEGNVIEARNITFSYPLREPVLDDITFEVPRNSIVSIIGPNGSGKTTLLELLIGSWKPTRGTITIRASVSFLYQEPEKQLFAPTVREEIALNGADLNDPELLNYLRLFELEHRLDEHPYFLSRGEKQKLLLLSIGFSKSELLLFDEPFTGLDSGSRDRAIRLMINLHARGKSIVMTAHEEVTFSQNYLLLSPKRARSSEGSLR